MDILDSHFSVSESERRGRYAHLFECAADEERLYGAEEDETAA